MADIRDHDPATPEGRAALRAFMQGRLSDPLRSRSPLWRALDYIDSLESTIAAARDAVSMYAKAVDTAARQRDEMAAKVLELERRLAELQSMSLECAGLIATGRPHLAEDKLMFAAQHGRDPATATDTIPVIREKPEP